MADLRDQARPSAQPQTGHALLRWEWRSANRTPGAARPMSWWRSPSGISRCASPCCDWVRISNGGRPPGECWAIISAVAAAGNSQCRHAIKPRLRCRQLSGERQQGRLLAIAAREMCAERQAICRPMQWRRARCIVQRRHRQISRHTLGEGLNIAVLVETPELWWRAGQHRRQDYVTAGQELAYLAPRRVRSSDRSMYSMPLTFIPRWYTAQVTASTSSGCRRV